MMVERTPEQWRKLVYWFGGIGLTLTVAGYGAISRLPLTDRTHSYLLVGHLAFYGGLALVITALVVWYRRVPPRPPEPDEPEESDDE